MERGWEQDVLLEFCESTITVDNVNHIPPTWYHDLLSEYLFTLDHCKKHGFGFLPLVMVLAMSAPLRWRRFSCWFVTTWKNQVDLDAEYPFTVYRFGRTTNQAELESITYSSLMYAINWNISFAHFLLLEGATPSFASFRQFLNITPTFWSQEHKQVALIHFDRGCVPLNTVVDNAWIQEKCRDYATRRVYCRHTLIRMGIILRRKPDWDRHLAWYLMRFVWATRWHEEWNK
jgi:hypothetical protein